MLVNEPQSYVSGGLIESSFDVLLVSSDAHWYLERLVVFRIRGAVVDILIGAIVSSSERNFVGGGSCHPLPSLVKRWLYLRLKPCPWTARDATDSLGWWSIPEANGGLTPHSVGLERVLLPVSFKFLIIFPWWLPQKSLRGLWMQVVPLW